MSTISSHVKWWGRGDLNPGSPAPQAGILVQQICPEPEIPAFDQTRRRPHTTEKKHEDLIINTLLKAKSKGIFFDSKTSSPDFYLQDYDVYVEYWGLVDPDDDQTRKQYVRKMKWKMAQYYKNNIKFISIYPDNLKNLDWIFRKKFRNVIGLELPN